ncbi:nitrate reductase molybdenum cofactor assembly chaperone [Nocardia amikacinitolerans]|uniref:nitrate reductase molybdenum cofactor assembly chaperone n=1 Tax=Nocardia amikacinitolerans TaxID=756689 RepID=UPI0020A5089D|nr:nitrate reductase molybdenum cofactor assembly chaperone [Nocardia amikacinitolerans]MCP2292530.1 respiratory nitrate reductase chaperone NarJ [Nocardia amikacinitolerans]
MTITDTDRILAWKAQSLLLAYPGDHLTSQWPLLRKTSAVLPRALGTPLRLFCDHAEHRDPLDLAADYVATFDHHKRFSPYLTYFAYGDTRKRGVALLRFKHTYRAAGMILSDDELPDHLAVVLEFAATADPAAGQRLLVEHRAGLELLRLGLHEISSVWAHVLDSVSATLPDLGRNEHDAIAALAAQGPPEEEVGLAPFGPPEYMPHGGSR